MKKTLLLMLASGLCLVLATAPLEAQKDKGAKKDAKKDDKAAAISREKLIGTWEVTEGGTAGDKGAVYEFTKDKVTISNKKKAGLTGTYKLDGHKISWKIGAAGITVDSPPMTISKLTDKELVFEDVAGGKTGLTKK